MPLHDSQIKLDRAKEHLDALSTQLQTFVERNPYTFTIEPNPAPPDFLVRAHGYALPDPRLGALVGDFAHNARSALDVLISRISNLPPDDARRFRLQFPIFDVETGSRGYRGREVTYLNGVGANEKAIIEDFQPYKRDADFASDLLGILANINDADKHRIINAGVAVTRVTVGMPGRYLPGLPPGSLIFVGERVDIAGLKINILNGGIITEDNAVVARVRAEIDVQMQPHAPIQMQFGEGSPRAQGRPLMDTLTAILSRVEEVLGRF